MNRRITAVALALALVAIAGACLAPLVLAPTPQPCARLSAPVQFTRIDARPVTIGLKTRQFPVVEYSYVVRGQTYRSTNIFCSESPNATVDWSKVGHFFDDARRGAGIVAWVEPAQPASACLSLSTDFSYSVLSNSAAQCRAP